MQQGFLPQKILFECLRAPPAPPHVVYERVGGVYVWEGSNDILTYLYILKASTYLPID